MNNNERTLKRMGAGGHPDKAKRKDEGANLEIFETTISFSFQTLVLN